MTLGSALLIHNDLKIAAFSFQRYLTRLHSVLLVRPVYFSGAGLTGTGAAGASTIRLRPL
jgi:hypothetical protein